MSGVLTQRHRGTEKRKLVDSGVAWIGKIPKGWKVSRIKYETETRNDVGAYNPESDRYIGLENLIPYGEALIQSDTTYPASNYSVCKKDDILFSKLRPYLAKCIIAPSDAFCTGEFVVIKSFSGNKVFLRYWLLADNVLSQIVGSTYGAKMPRAAESFILNLPISIPLLAEQQRIAAFLDRECEKIDGLRGKIEKQIEKLDELKKSTITEAVTGKIGVGGRCRSRKMKPSGVEWIGDVPEEWKTCRVKNLATQEGSLFLDGDWINSDVIESEGIRYLTSGNVGPGYFKVQGSGYISERTFGLLNCLKVFPGDLMMCRLNEPLGRACIVPDGQPFYVIAVDNVVLRPDEMYDKRYIMYCMNTDGYAFAAFEAAAGATMKRISRTDLGNLKIPIPPLAEQKEIAEYLDKKCAAIDAAKEKCRVQLEKLAEYKKSLIYEYVTGKREVA